MSDLPPAVLARLKYDANGVPYASFRKDVLKVGHLAKVSPQTGENWRMDVTPAMLETLSANSNRMLAEGCPIEATVNHSPSARDIVGYVRSFSVEGDTLWTDQDIKGLENIELALVSENVSVEIEEDFVSGAGENYGMCITAVSIVQQPVQADQTAFKIAASLRTLDGTGFELVYCDHDSGSAATTTSTSTSNPETNMDAAKTKQEHDQKAAEHAELAKAHADLAQKHAELEMAHKAHASRIAELELRNKQVEDEAAELKKKLSLAEAEAKKLSLAASASPEAEQLFEERGEGVREKLLSLSGRTVELTPALLEKLVPVLTKGDGASRRVMLSRTSAGEEGPARSIAAILAADAKEKGVKTGMQLSRKDAGAIAPGTSDEAAEHKAEVERMKAHVTGAKK